MNDLLLSLNYLKYAYTIVTATRSDSVESAVLRNCVKYNRQKAAKRFKSVDLKELLKSLIVMRFLHCSVQARGLPC